MLGTPGDVEQFLTSHTKTTIDNMNACAADVRAEM